MHWLLRLYPRAWRERYEQEMLVLLEEHKITPATVLDLLIGALDAHLNYNGVTEGVTYMVNRLRTGVVMIFCAFMLFGVGWSMLQRLTDPLNQFNAVAMYHPEFRVLFDADFIAGCLSFLAFLIGGLPVFFISLRRAIKHRQKNVLIPFAVALSCLLTSILATAVLANWHHIAYALTHIYVFLGGYVALMAVMLIVGTVAVSLMIQRTDFQLSELKFVFIPEVVILFCMGVAVVMATILIITITAYAPQLFNTQDVGSPMFITGLFCMALGTIFGAMGIRRGMVTRITE
ncbi:hypothetical protein [Alicyclobacillus acidoterrestris]|uniref:Uncharacterized protein n=1 Tax=Alicyclobacillus acidoterrestris (strain ATCC 49025 / DSM 3922 / CIP 106132 / NCIMB 13137 / GD3B) TaxID=1356854 RepID=T0BUL4_ALIAG|nr:hypothetical protein [Alicyclobacillus acidoterrestris]EPZ44494.1 hypothetical protein N007_11050 [Alicyclobacillus acidoterrestris ATCC 49025]UNO49336.1 hypothetical protein K1I37_01915 [Alicyclobacillus acidoterrestris]